jgi:hypothetical protein
MESTDTQPDGQELERPPETGSDANLHPKVKAKLRAAEEDPAEDDD